MGYLDDIGQRSPAARQRSAPTPIDQYRPAGEPARPAREERNQDSSRPGVLREWVTWVAVLVAVIVIGVGGWLGLQRFAAPSAASAEVPAAEETVAATPSETPAPARSTVRAVNTARQAPKAVAANAATVPTVTPAVVSDESPAIEAPAIEATTAETAASGKDADAQSQTAEVTDSTAPTLETAPAADAPVTAAITVVVPADDTIYSPANADVVAPRMTSLGFGAPLVNGLVARTSAIELWISQDGSVERARLIAPSHNMADAMLISRAKHFQFVPALRDGLPVRYRFVMEVESIP